MSTPMRIHNACGKPVKPEQLKGSETGRVVTVHALYRLDGGSHYLVSYCLDLYHDIRWIARNAISMGRAQGYTDKGSIRFILERRAA